MLKIYKYGEQVLRVASQKVVLFDEELKLLIKNMFDSMYHNKGIGLAAPQIGVSKSLMVIDTRENDTSSYALINPVIEKEGNEQIAYQEGCLSFPGILVDITRHKKIKVKAQDENGEPIEFEADDLLARVIQHEFDHLKGVLFVDYLNIVQKSLVAGKLKKLQKETMAESHSN